MAEEKKMARPSLPLPTQTPASPVKKSRVWKFLAISLLLSIIFSFHYSYRAGSLEHATPLDEHNHPHLPRRRTPFGKRAEEAFLSVPNRDSAIQASRLFATKPHMAGTPGDLTTAKDFLKLLQKELHIHPPSEEPIYVAGSSQSQHAIRSISKANAWIDIYYPVMNTPLERSLQIVDKDTGSSIWEANLVEVADSTDPEAGKYFDSVPTFHGLSRSGDVTGHVVDGNYCTQDDYQNLVAKDVNLKGAIVLCRYGGIFRGLKVKGGEELGAIGVLIYSDPKDDGTVTVENGYLPYPHGPARNPTSVQRGSVQYLSVYPGDPTTPGYPSYENSTRTEGTNIPLIPSLPISWENAATIFKTLTKGDSYEGQSVRLVNKVDTKVTPIWNTMGVIPGFIRDEVVVIGNHRDAWVMGAADPSSGTASIHETIRGLGHLLHKGWKPLRSIVIASWDAEEYGLIGSTEWGEDFADWIDDHVVAYLNLDSSVSGSRLGASGSPLLSHFIRDIAQEIEHPTDENRTLWDATKDTGKLFGTNVTTAMVDPEVISIRKMEIAAADSVGITPLGSGSDYTVFLQRNGIASTNGGFGATLHDPVYHYHSVFDSERWQEEFGDPGFHRHIAIAKLLGLQTIRLASSALLPFNTTHYAFEIESYLNKVENLALEASIDIHLNSLKKSIKNLQKGSIKLDKEKAKVQKELRKIVGKWKTKYPRNWRIKTFVQKFKCKGRKMLKSLTCKVKKTFTRSCVNSCSHKAIFLEEAPGISVPTIVPENDVLLGTLLHEGFEGNAIEFHLGLNHGHGLKFPFNRLRKLIQRIREVNKKTATFERGFISEEGIKNREWYKHLAVAPGKWLGYGATTLPALTEAITFEKNSTLAQEEVDRLQYLIDKLVENIRI